MKKRIWWYAAALAVIVVNALVGVEMGVPFWYRTIVGGFAGAFFASKAETNG